MNEAKADRIFWIICTLIMGILTLAMLGLTIRGMKEEISFAKPLVGSVFFAFGTFAFWRELKRRNHSKT